MGGRSYSFTPLLGLPLHWSDGGMVDGHLHNRLAEKLDDIVGNMGKGWKLPVTAFVDLPLFLNVLGDARVVTSEARIYVWDGVTWKPSNEGAVSFIGTWDAFTNTPALTDATGVKGFYYVVSVGGSQDLGSGSISYSPGDWVIHNGSIWQKADHTDVVTSVFGRQGAVVKQAGDYDHADLAAIGASDHHARYTDAEADARAAAAIVTHVALPDPHTQYMFGNSIQRIGWRFAPTSNGTINMLGWYIQTDVAAALASGAPVTPAVPGYHSHFVLNVSAAVGLPFTVRFTGTSIDENTGAEIPADTEDLAVTVNGYYQTVKSWVTAPSISIVEGAKSCTIDIYRITYWDRGNNNFTVVGCRLEFEPDAPTWSIQFNLYRVNDDGSMTTIDSTTFADSDTPPRAANGDVGKYKRGDYSTFVAGAVREGLVIEIIQTNIADLYVEVTYNE